MQLDATSRLGLRKGDAPRIAITYDELEICSGLFYGAINVENFTTSKKILLINEQLERTWKHAIVV